MEKVVFQKLTEFCKQNDRSIHTVRKWAKRKEFGAETWVKKIGGNYFVNVQKYQAWLEKMND
jgi:hypothetical protein